MSIITTSWDDGHPLDFRLAELLHKYKLQGTFYIPKSNLENEVMGEGEVADLSKSFDIGGHTLSHIRLTNQSALQMNDEISGCYRWLTEITGTAPVSFCFPGGRYNDMAIRVAFDAGFKILRTTELLCTDALNKNILPTTIQIFDHTSLTLTAHLLKRRKFGSLRLFIDIGRFKKLERLVEAYLHNVLSFGGCLHLWGHSWEIEQFNFWSRLEDIFSIVSNISECTYVNNSELHNLKLVAQ